MLTQLNHLLSILLILLITNQSIANKSKQNQKEARQIKIGQIKSYLEDQPDSAIFLTKKMLSEIENKDDSLIAIGQYLIGIAYYYQGNYFISSSFYSFALSSDYVNKNLNFKSSCLNNLGINYELTDQYDKAITQYLNCIEIDKKLGNHLGIAQTQLNIGLLYNHLNQLPQAYKYLNNALEYFKSIDDHHHLGLAYHNLGKIQMDQHQYHLAIKSLEKSYQEFLKTSSHYERGMLLNNLILCSIELGKLETAKKYLEESKKIIDENNFEFLRSTYLTTKVNLLIALKEFDKASEVLHTIKSYNSRTTENIVLLDARLSILKGDKSKAEEYLDKYADFRDSLESVKNTKLVNELDIKYQTDANRKTIIEQSLNINKKRNQIFLLIIFGSISLVLFIIIFILYKNLERSYQKIYQLNSFQSKHFLSQNKDNKNETYNELWNQILELNEREKLWLNSKITIEDIAIKLNTNKSYISKTIKTNTNNNFSNFLNQMRIEEAKKILNDQSFHNYTMEAIAEMSGFNSTSSFYRIFKDHTGITPKGFKRLSSS